MEEKTIIKIIKYWLPVFIWCALIYYLSSIPELKSDLPNQWDFVARKIAHMAEYGFLTFLFFRAAIQGLSFKKSILYSALFATTYALTDEYHQMYVLGRVGSLKDVFIDGIGIFLVIFLIDKKLINVSIKS
jgi:VanZ family protein